MNYKENIKQVSLHQQLFFSKSLTEAHFKQAVNAVIYLFLNLFMGLHFFRFFYTHLYLQCM